MIFSHTPPNLIVMGRQKRVDDDEILRAIAISPDPIVTASELSERLDYSDDGIRNRLSDLEEGELVMSRDVGARAKVWWITTQGRQRLP